MWHLVIPVLFDIYISNRLIQHSGAFPLRMINWSDICVVSWGRRWMLRWGPSLYLESPSFLIGLPHKGQAALCFIPTVTRGSFIWACCNTTDNLSLCCAPVLIWQQEIYCLNRVPVNKNIIAGACQMNPLNQDNFCLGMLSGADCSIHFCNLTRLPLPVLCF